jgi:hypothetical protein
MEWISVEDRLPKDYQLVIVDGGVARLQGDFWYSYTGSNGRFITWRVTHWMPLPEPPK